MRLLTIVPPNTKIDFVGKRRIAFAFSLTLMLVSIGTFAFQGLNFGIDFRGGILIEISTHGPANIPEIRRNLGALNLGDVQIQQFGAPNDVLIRVQQQEGDDSAQQRAVTAIKQTLGDSVAEYRRTETVGPTVGGELIRAAIIAVTLALAAILVYVWFRFEWQFGVGAVVALTHDVIATIGLFAVTQMEFNLATVAAVLTIAGYSINDTVVIYDRVREELRRYKKMPLVDLLNLSTNRTLSRTFLTSFTTLLALFALVLLGGPIIRGFSLAMIFGIVVGTYSSVFIAVPALLLLNLGRQTFSGDDTPPQDSDAAAQANASDD